MVYLSNDVCWTYASSKSVNTVPNGEDLDPRSRSPPRAPGANAPPIAYKIYDKAERAYNRYQESRLLVYATLFQSESKYSGTAVVEERRSWEAMEIP